MKKQIALAMGLTFMSGSVFATKARLQALGEDVNGSQFISDNRNVFLNSATLNYHKDIVTMEWGDTTNGADSSQTPRAEGGFFKSTGNMAYGVYLGSESDTANGLRAAAGVSNTNAAFNGTNGMAEQNNIDLFIAGDAGVQWGANVTYHSYSDEQNGSGNDITSDSLRTRLGVISGNTEAFLNVSIVGTAENKGQDTELEGKGAYDLGVAHQMDDLTYMARVQQIGAEEKDGDEFSSQKISLGAAKEYKINSMTNIWVSGFVKQDTYTCDFDSVNIGPGVVTSCGILGRDSGDTKDTYIPVTVAAEINVKEWLTLRGSVAQNVYGVNENDDGDEATMANSTVVNAGASLIFGDLQFDGVIGNAETCENVDVNSDGTNDNVACGADANSNAGILNTENIMSRVSMTYRF